MMSPTLLVLGLAAVTANQSADPGGAAHAVARPRADTVYVFVQLEDDEPGDLGGRGTAGWLREVSPQVTSELGVSMSRLPGTKWVAGRAGGSFKKDARTIFSGAVTLGGGARNKSSFPYQIYKGGVRRTYPAARIGLEVEDQYFRIDETRGHLIKIAGDAVLHRAVVAQAAYHAGLGGNLDARFVSLRFDTQHRRVGLLGGFSIGRTLPDIVDIGFTVEALDSKEFFGGVRIARGTQEFSLILDALKVEGLRRFGVGLGWTIVL